MNGTIKYLNASVQVWNGTGPTLACANSTSDEAQPESRFIQALHRGEDGFVTFNRIDTASDSWVDVGAVRVSDVGCTLPTMTQHLVENAYFSVNSMYRAGFWLNPSTNLTHTLRGEEHLRWLNANYADLDCYKKDLDFYDAFAGVIKATDEGLIPPASLICRSGKGVWLFWLLHASNDPALPVRAYSQAVALYRETQTAIVGRLEHLGADRAAVDAARVTRVPGSLNPKANPGFKRVTYWQQHDATGAPYSYTPVELATWFGILPRPSIPTPLPRPQPSPAPRGFTLTTPELSQVRRRGWVARWAKDRLAFETLRRLRGGFRKRHRDHAIFVYAILLRKQGTKPEEIERLVCELGRECHPRVEASRCRYLAKKIPEKYVNRHIARKTIIGLLGVTADEARHLPQWFPPPAKPKRLPAAQRHDMICAEVERLGIVPSCAEMAFFLNNHDFKVTKRLVALDYHKLALISSGHAGRPKKQ